MRKLCLVEHSLGASYAHIPCTIIVDSILIRCHLHYADRLLIVRIKAHIHMCSDHFAKGTYHGICDGAGILVFIAIKLEVGKV